MILHMKRKRLGHQNNLKCNGTTHYELVVQCAAFVFRVQYKQINPLMFHPIQVLNISFECDVLVTLECGGLWPVIGFRARQFVVSKVYTGFFLNKIPQPAPTESWLKAEFAIP